MGPVKLSYTERGSRPAHSPPSWGRRADFSCRLGRIVCAYPPRSSDYAHAPGLRGTPRPDGLSSVRTLAGVYGAFLDQLGLEGVTVIGNSVGGWIAAELALASPGRLSSLIIVDAAGIDVPGHPVADAFSLPFEEISRLSYHNPERFRVDLAKFPPAQRAIMASNFATLKAYANPMTDPTLIQRLSKVAIPTLVAWGDSDRIVDVTYGRAYAEAIPGSTFHLMRETGHLPQIETPDQLSELVWKFMQQRTERRVPTRSGRNVHLDGRNASFTHSGVEAQSPLGENQRQR